MLEFYLKYIYSSACHKKDPGNCSLVL